MSQLLFVPGPTPVVLLPLGNHDASGCVGEFGLSWFDQPRRGAPETDARSMD